eukprot:UN03452
MVQTQFQAEKLSDRRVLRRDVHPTAIFMWEVTKNKYQAYPEHISKLCEEVWQEIRTEIKRKESVQETDTMFLTEDRLDKIEAAIRGGAQPRLYLVPNTAP